MKRKMFDKLHLGQPRRLTAGLTRHEHPAVAPDGRFLAYYCGEYGSIHVFVTDMRGRLARRVSPNSGNSTQPAWHPTGRRLAYRHQHTNDSKWELWETALTGEIEPRQLLADPRWHYKHPFYDEAGERLAYFTDENSPGVFHVWIWDIESGERKQVTFGEEQGHCHPVFSPDGTRIAYHAYHGTDENALPAVVNLQELNLATGLTRVLTTGEHQYKHPFYIDDGAITFHFENNTDGSRRLCAMHLKNAEIVELTDGDDNDKHPFPFADRQGQLHLAWSSKKLGEELEGEPNNYDIFIAELLA